MTEDYRTVPADEVFATLSVLRQKTIEARAAELIAEVTHVCDSTQSSSQTKNDLECDPPKGLKKRPCCRVEIG